MRNQRIKFKCGKSGPQLQRGGVIESKRLLPDSNLGVSDSIEGSVSHLLVCLPRKSISLLSTLNGENRIQAYRIVFS